jgi:hypothetical protein
MSTQVIDVETRRQNILVALELGMIDADAAEDMLRTLIEEVSNVTGPCVQLSEHTFPAITPTPEIRAADSAHDS